MINRQLQGLAKRPKTFVFKQSVQILNYISDIYVGIHYIHYLLGSPVFRLEDGEACCSYALQTVM